MEVENATGRYQFGYVYHEGQLVGQVNPDGTKLYMHDDAEGSTSVVTNESGQIIENTTYSPFGEILSGGAVSRFDSEGKDFDSVVGDYDFNFRKFCVQFGIFCSPDTSIKNIYNPQDLNRYSFESNNPYRYTDLSGHVYWGDLTYAATDLYFNLELGLEGVSTTLGGLGLDVLTRGASTSVSVPLVASGTLVTTYAVGSATISGANIIHAINEEEPEAAGFAEQVGGKVAGQTGKILGAGIDAAASLYSAGKAGGEILKPKSAGTPLYHSVSVVYNFVSAFKTIQSILSAFDYKKKEEKKKEEQKKGETAPPSNPLSSNKKERK